ncbi:MAG: sulfatase-like hydrolase/transferase [Chloroflexota bacterium]
MTRRNVLFLMVDCMRSDVIYDRARYPFMPVLDGVLARGSSFANTITAATTTTPSVATMLTGRYPAEHGVRSLLGYKLQDGVRTFPQILQEHGYHTVAEMTGPLFPLTGLDRGFSTYRRRERSEYLDTAWGTEVLSTLSNGSLPEPWFMFLHLWELHWPRMAKGQFRDARYGKHLYQRSAAYLDSQLQRIFHAIDPEKTLVVMTGDHGEGIAGAIDDPRAWVQLAIRLGYKVTAGLPADTKKRILSLGKRAVLQDNKRDSHELAGHAALQVYDYLVRVPLVFFGPGLIPENSRPTVQVRHIDAAPTILDAVGIDPAAYGLQPSLLPAMRGEDTTDRPALTEALPTMLHDPNNRLLGLRTGRYKYICAPDNPDTPRELYDLVADPGERQNLASSQPQIVEEQQRQLEAILAGQTGADISAQRMTAEEEDRVRRRLEELGYLE